MPSEPGDTWDLGELPVQVGVRGRPTNAPLPDTLPLRVEIDANSGVVVQRYDEHVAEALSRAYEVGAPLGTPLAETGLGKPGLDDFLGYIVGLRGANALVGARVLEIGSGEGALLGALARSGADPIGVEPGADAVALARGRGLTVVNEPFSPEVVDGRFDMIVHHAVLEHVRDPTAFLADQLSLLCDDGLVICSVPDCSEPIARGDVSVFMHEHLSYFTPASLGAVGYAAGAELVDTRLSTAAGAFYSAWRSSDRDVRSRRASRPRCELSAGVRERTEQAIARVRDWLGRRGDDGATVGIYVPPRFLNYQALIGEQAADVRFFDDDPAMTGKYLPPVAIPIESRAGLLENPVDELLIVSWTFGRRLARALAAEPALAATRITTIDEVLGA